MKDLNLDIKVSTVGADDRPDLEGEFVVVVDRDGDENPGIVIGCNKSVGLTIVNPNDKTDQLLCVRGPVCPNPTSRIHIDYDNSWLVMTQMIEAGVYYMEKHDALRTDGGSGQGGGMSCAYSQ
jgi:hypothetical protein